MTSDTLVARLDAFDPAEVASALLAYESQQGAMTAGNGLGWLGQCGKREATPVTTRRKELYNGTVRDCCM